MTAPVTTSAEPSVIPPPPPPESPWMTLQETAVYTRMHENQVREALHECVHTSGRRGLKGYQRKPNASWRVHREDADRWLRGEAPARGTRRAA